MFVKLSFVYYLSKGRGYVMRSFCLFVCLSVCRITAKNQPISLKLGAITTSYLIWGEWR